MDRAERSATVGGGHTIFIGTRSIGLIPLPARFRGRHRRLAMSYLLH